jgi:hypothetical protein
MNLRLVTFSLLLLAPLTACGSDDDDQQGEKKACGGLLGSDCADKLYCKYDSANCGRADQTGVCTVKPEICTMIYAPVCGCDGQTYASDCAAASKGMTVETQGECPKLQE